MPHRATDTPICPACGCSLIRLGIDAEKAAKREHKHKTHRFCCEGCAVLFDEDPAASLAETGSMIVCPSCLAEKLPEHTVAIEHQGKQLLFCRCPHCVTVFLKNPDFYLERLAGGTDFQGIFSSDQGCCGESPADTAIE